MCHEDITLKPPQPEYYLLADTEVFQQPMMLSCCSILCIGYKVLGKVKLG